MREIEIQPASHGELHQFVHNTLCEAENLLSEQFETRQHLLITHGQLCGIEYSLLGLRSIRLGAIWVASQNMVFFYNARGERYLKAQLAAHRSP